MTGAPRVGTLSGALPAGLPGALSGPGGGTRYRRHCPVCHGSINRIPRRFVDLVWSIFKPVHRYHCRSMACDWEGNLAAK